MREITDRNGSSRMMSHSRGFTILVVMLIGSLLSVPAVALGPCDCTVSGWIGTCVADLEVTRETWVKVRTNVPKTCSRVDWYADNDPQMTVVIDGAEIENLAPRKPTTLTVQSCKICKDLRTDRVTSDQEPQGPLSNPAGSESASLESLVIGVWTGQGTNKTGTHPIRMTIERQGQELKGTLTFTDGDHQMKSIRVSGNDISFTQSHVIWTVQWKGTYNPSSRVLSGSTAFSLGVGTFELRKQ